MRKIIGVVVSFVVLGGAGAALAGQGATNSTGEFIDLNVSVSPPVAGTAKAPQGVGVAFDSFTGNRINGDISSGNNSIAVRFNNGFQYNGLTFPSCTVNPDPNGFSSCTHATQIGTGVGELGIPGANGAPPTFVSAQLLVYNGKPFKSKAPTIIFQGVLNGKVVDELDFTAQQQASGPYGLAFTEIQFPATAGGGGVGGLTKFSVTIPRKSTHQMRHGKRVTTYLIQAPTTCHGAWQFAQTNGFTNAAPLTATDSQPCTTH
ncbi:MAG: hypothetical protein ACR2NR_12680 [Solirubrobacteraceae bacterium]